MQQFPIALGIVLLSLTAFATAQDTRAVTEPILPPACRSLDAHLATTSGAIASSDESKLDTERIQHAIDTCSKGHAVVLHADGTDNAFLSGPLQLRRRHLDGR